MINLKTTVFINWKPVWVIVDETGKILNRNPTKEELKYLKIFTKDGRSKYRSSITNEQIIEKIVNFVRGHKRIPTREDFDNNPKEYPSSNLVRKRLGGWNNAIRMAGFVPDICPTEEELLDYLVQSYVENERHPTMRDFTNNPRYPSFNTYIYRFGSWSNALKLVGLDIESMVKKGVVENMKKYEITEQIRNILKSYRFFGKSNILVDRV